MTDKKPLAEDTWLHPKNGIEHLIANTPTDKDVVEELATRLRIKADMISMGEKIAWGSETALMYEAADALTQHRREVEEARREAAEMIHELTGGEASVWFTICCEITGKSTEETREIVKAAGESIRKKLTALTPKDPLPAKE